MRISTVVTRVGDKGTTRTVGNQEISKAHPRIDVSGTIDELNAVLGTVSAELAAAQIQPTSQKRLSLDQDSVLRLQKDLRTLQHRLFDLGADLACPISLRWEGFAAISAPDIEALELEIEGYLGDLRPLEEFVLPGGGPIGAGLHLARTVCRRAERATVALMELAPEETNSEAMRYLNRLSDLLFVLARWAASRSDYGEVMWQR